MIKLIIMGIVCGLWVWGGQRSNRYRDVGVPLILGFSLIFLLRGDLLHRLIASIGTIAGLNAIRIGYGNYEKGEKNSFLAKLTKDRRGAVVRLLWGLLVGFLGAIVLFLMNYLTLPRYALYGALNAILGYSVSKLRLSVLPADLLVGAGVSSVLLLIP